VFCFLDDPINSPCIYIKSGIKIRNRCKFKIGTGVGTNPEPSREYRRDKLKKDERLQTQISKACWCESDGKYSAAEMPLINPGKDIFWLDMLLRGGFSLPTTPKEKNRALTILVTGPPGTGKSTLAMELCYRWALSRKLSTLYLTSETNAELAIKNAESFGWEKAADTIYREKDIYEPQNNRDKMVRVLQTKDFKEYFGNIDNDDLSGLKKFGKAIGLLWKISAGDIEKVGDTIVTERLKQKIDTLLKVSPDVFVIDSLNTVDRGDQGRFYNQFTNIVTAGPKIIITVLESDRSKSSAEFWEYFSDVVIRMDWKELSDYRTRTIEIIKARFQSHVHGAHQLKILTPPKHSYGQQGLEARLDHPYRKEGGIFIYPSIHSYLSIYKRHSVSKPAELFTTPIPALNEMLCGGFPMGRCIGFIGQRGKHKSHLGYLCALSRLFENGARKKDLERKVLIVSLRDDIELVRKTMNGILKEEHKGYSGSISDLEKEDKIEILYFPPGYITPEEFYHRMFMSVQRLKYGGTSGQKRSGNDAEVTVLFNSLDHLSSYFPLCAREEIFIPGIISTLSYENVTSFFISVEDTDRPHGHYGLSSMAEALLYFTDENVRTSYFLEQMKNHFDFKDIPDATDFLAKRTKDWPETINATVMRVKRFAGGQEAGVGGVLELVRKKTSNYRLYRKSGLRFIPFDTIQPRRQE